MILILDDHPLARQGLSSLIQNYKKKETIYEAGTVKECMSFMKRKPVDLAFIDINLGSDSENGFNLIKWMKDKKLDTKIFIITSSSRQCDFNYAQDLDVDAYVLKESFIDEITYGLKSIERGEKFYSSAIMVKLNKISVDEKAINSLTHREMEVLSLISQGLTNEKISKTLFISLGTVKKHVTNIFSKLELESRVEAVIFANKNTYVLENTLDQYKNRI